MNHTLTWQDVFDGRAEVNIPPESLLLLAKLAGAPWNDMDPDAELSDLQKEIITTPERTVVVFGGSRGGKSVSAAVIALGQLMIPNAKIALIGANYEHCSKEFDYIWRGFFKLFPRSACTEAQFITRSPHFSMRLKTIWGSSVQVFSTISKEGAQILGNEFDMAILCEAAQVPDEVFNTKVERALLGRAKQRTGQNYLRRTGRAILLTTPKGQGGASYDIYNRALARTKGNLQKLRLANGAEWFESLYFCQANVRELNPTYPVEAFEHARRTLPKHSFEEQFLGRAIIRSGLVYSSFKEETHVLPAEKLPPVDVMRRSTFGVGVDTGTNFAAILAVITPENKAYVIGEVFEVGQNTRQNADAILDMVTKTLEPYFPSPKEAVALWVVDVNSQNIMDLEEALDVGFYHQKYDLLESIGTLDVRMGAGEIAISEECDFLLHEMRGYRYKHRDAKGSSPRKDTPIGVDHCLDAMRYLLMQLFELGAPKEPETVFTVDEILNREREEMLTCNMKRDLENAARRQTSNFLEARW